jgi:hypothetical protein
MGPKKDSDGSKAKRKVVRTRGSMSLQQSRVVPRNGKEKEKKLDVFMKGDSLSKQ